MINAILIIRFERFIKVRLPSATKQIRLPHGFDAFVCKCGKRSLVAICRCHKHPWTQVHPGQTRKRVHKVISFLNTIRMSIVCWLELIWLLRFTWILVTIGGFVASNLLVETFWQRYKSNPTRLSVESSYVPLNQLDIPAVTFCQISRVDFNGINTLIDKLQVQLPKYHDTALNTVWLRCFSLHFYIAFCRKTWLRQWHLNTLANRPDSLTTSSTTRPNSGSWTKYWRRTTTLPKWRPSICINRAMSCWWNADGSLRRFLASRFLSHLWVITAAVARLMCSSKSVLYTNMCLGLRLRCFKFQ